MDDLIAFLRARLDEDEQLSLALDETAYNGVESTAGSDARAYLERAAAEVEAKRQLLDELAALDGDPVNGFAVTRMTRLLALPYADHPDHPAE